MIKRILVGVSGMTELETPIAYTIEIAKRHGAKVEVLTCIDTDTIGDIGPIPIGGGHFADQMIAKRIEESHEIGEHAVAEFAAATRKAGLKTSVIVAEGDPLPVMSGLWRYVDLCILSAHSWFNNDAISDPETSLAKLLASGVRPIFTLPQKHRPVRKVMIAYDGALEAAKTLKQYFAMRLFPDVSVEIVCAGETDTGERPQTVLDDAADYIAEHGIQCSQVQLTGDNPTDALLDHAHAKEIDLVVMGSSFRRVLFANRFGRSTVNMLRKADIPLFISH